MNNRLKELFDNAISILHQYEPKEGYYVAFSGGKDSIVILDLVQRSGVKYDAHFNITSVDPPELIAFIKEHYPYVVRHRPERTMFQLIEQKALLPMRRQKFCCEILKERGGTGRLVITGIRKAESHRRSKRSMFEISKIDKTKAMIHLIIDWKDKDVWDYIKILCLPYPCLYDEGFSRIGCIGCPEGSTKQRILQFQRYPNHKKAYINALNRGYMLRDKKQQSMSAEDKVSWWVSGLSIKKYVGMKEQTEISLIDKTE